MLSKYSHIPDRFLASLVSQQLTVAGTSLLGHGAASASLEQQRSQQRQSEMLRSWYSGSPRLCTLDFDEITFNLVSPY
jgi:hypothetical protein